MNTIQLGKNNLEVSEISLGCMRMSGLSDIDAAHVIQRAMELEISFFDHADIYGGGESEKKFAKAIEKETFDSRKDVPTIKSWYSGGVL